MLAERAPELVGKDELIRQIWGDVVVSDETLAQRVRLLRQALGDDSSDPRYFTAVRGRGYRLIAPVEPAGEAGPRGPAPRRSRRGVAMIVVGAAVVALAAAIVWRGLDKPAAVDRLAVLPFDDISQGSDYGFFADGMQEELLARLAKLGRIDVLSRTSVERFRETGQGVPEIADALDVDAVIEGSIRVTGDKLRITVQLIDGDTDRHLWVETYDSVLTVEGIFDIQRDVAERIAAALEVEYRPGGRSELPTTSLDAYNFYLLGRYHAFRPTPENLDTAILNLGQAVALDPSFAEAHTALGWALAFQGTDYGSERPRDVFPLAREAALEALRLDDTLAGARELYAAILTWYDRAFELAESEYRRTLALEPANVLGYALFLSTQNRHAEAIELVERRAAESPDDPWVRVNLAWRYLSAGRTGDAVRAARDSAGHPDARSALGLSLLASGDAAAAVRVFEEDIERQGRGTTQLANLALGYYRAGRESDGRPLLDELEALAAQRYVPAVPRAAIYVAAGDRERAYELLEQAVDDRERGVIFLAVSHSFDELADESRFAALVERVGLPGSDTAGE